MTPQELKQNHPEIWASWFQEGFDQGVAVAREAAVKELASMKASGRERTSSENIVDAWFAAAFPQGISVPR